MNEQISSWLDDVPISEPPSGDTTTASGGDIEWVTLGWDLHQVGDRLLASVLARGRPATGSTLKYLVFAELNSTTMEPTLLNRGEASSLLGGVAEILDTDAGPVAHVKTHDHGFRWWLLGQGPVDLPPPTPSTEMRADLLGLTEVDGRWLAAGMYFERKADGTPIPPRRIGVFSSEDGRTFEVAATVDDVENGKDVYKVMTVHGAHFEPDGSGVLLGMYQEGPLDENNAVNLRVPLMIEFDQGPEQFTTVFDPRQQDQGSLQHLERVGDATYLYGWWHPNREHEEFESTHWEQTDADGFRPVDTTCDGDDSWSITSGLDALGLAVGARSRGGAHAEPVVLWPGQDGMRCILPQAYGVAMDARRFSSAVSLAQVGYPGMALVVDDAGGLWTIQPATGPETPLPPAPSTGFPTEEWLPTDPITPEFVSEVINELFRLRLDVFEGVRERAADGSLQEDRQWMADAFATITTPTGTAETVANLIRSGLQGRRDPAGPIVMSNVELVETTRHCIAFEAVVDSTAVFEPPPDLPSGLESEPIGIVLLAQPTNPTGWALDSAQHDNC